MSRGTSAVILIAAVLAAGNAHAQRRGEREATISDLKERAIEIEAAAPIEGSTAKAIESYQRFLDLNAEDPLLRAEAMRRLADLKLEAADAEELASNVAALTVHSRDSVQLYERLLAAYPRYAKNDLVLYQLARAYEAAGEPQAALETLDRLVAEYPDTPFYDEAQFRRGETLFVRRRYAQAESAYAEVLRRGSQSPFYEQALYKHGWSLFKQLRHEQSLPSFFALLDRKLLAEDENGIPIEAGKRYAAMGRAVQELIDDTLRVLSVSFSYMDGASAISAQLDEFGAKPYAYILYKNLGDLYLEQERYQDAAAAYQAFADREPHHARAPLLQVEAIEAYRLGGFASLVLDGKRDFVERYGPDSAYWDRFDYREQPEVVAGLKAHLTDLAAHHHARAQASKDASEYALAARWYRSYLRSFPDDEEAAHMHFLLAEVLYESADYRAAALEYERASYGYPLHPRSAEAGYAALLAYAAHERGLSGAERTAWHRQSIESALRFSETYPQHEHAASVQTDAAERLFDLHELARARDVARGVITRQPPPDTSLVRTAWTVVGHAEFDLARYPEAETAYLALAALLPAGDEARGEVVERIASSIYKQGEQARERGDTEAAVEHFLRVGRAAPESQIRATAQYDAASALIQDSHWSRAASVLEDFRSQFPDHPLADQVAANLAVAYVEVGDDARAATEFERIASSDPDPEARREALWRAAELYAESGRIGESAAAYARYVEHHPQPVAVAIEARQRLVELAEQSGDHAARMRWLADIVSADAAAGSDRTERTRYLAAKAQLAIAQPARDAFAAVRLVAPLPDSLRLKQSRMEAALEAYGKAADYGVAEVTTAATYEIAELYHRLSRDLLESERPPELAADELEQYEILLEEQAFPFEEQAIDLHEINVARVAEGIYDAWVQKSFEALAVLVPVRYAKSEMGERFVSIVQ